MKKYLKWILIAVAAALVLMQFANPSRTNPPVEPGHDLFATNPPPPHIAATLHAACYDCHSYETKWPWYGHVAPVSFWLASHINEGREHLNFSDWPHDNPQRAAKRWNHVAEEVRKGDMPWPSYTWIHHAARLTPQQRQELVDWAAQQAQMLKAQTAE